MSWNLAVHSVFTRIPYKYCSPTFCQCMSCALKALSALKKFRGDWLTFQGKEIWVLLFRVKASRDLKTLPLSYRTLLFYILSIHPAHTIFRVQECPALPAYWGIPFLLGSSALHKKIKCTWKHKMRTVEMDSMSQEQVCIFYIIIFIFIGICIFTYIFTYICMKIYFH